MFNSIFILILTIILFQNCSQVKFDESLDNNSKKNLNPSYTVNYSPEKSFEDVDILFVLDESISMKRVLSKIMDGFDSASKANYPKNTRMAITNMAPAQVKNNEIDFNTQFVPRTQVSDFPGFMKLVSHSTIMDFYYNSETEIKYKSNFTQPGCSEWFQPTSKNSYGVNCLLANSQITLFPTGVEAGTVSLHQLIKKYNSEEQKLFRDGALVNIIFVSDTHDPGANYYGRNNAYTTPLTVNELKQSLLSNNENISGIKFNGIVPLPEKNNPLLKNLNVVGDLKNTFDEVKEMTNEGLHGFHYLDFIKSTGGIATNIVNSNWTQAIQSMIEQVGKSNDIIFKIPGLCLNVTSLKLNGISVETESFQHIKSIIKITDKTIKAKNYKATIECEN